MRLRFRISSPGTTRLSLPTPPSTPALEPPDQEALPALLGPLDNLDSKVLAVKMATQARLVPTVSAVTRDPLAFRVMMEMKECLATLDHPETLDLPDQMDLLVCLVCPDPKDTEDSPDAPVGMASKESRETRVTWDRQALSAPQELPVHVDPQEREDATEPPAPQESVATMEHPAVLVPLDQSVPPAPPDSPVLLG